jgi:hypothetical protein
MSVSRRDGWHEPSFCESRWLWLAAEADEVVQIESVEPRFDVFAGLAVLPNVFREAGQRFRHRYPVPAFPCRLTRLRFPMARAGS